jgi:hypothetical protein
MEILNKDNKNEFDNIFAPIIFEIIKAIKNTEDHSKTRQELIATLKVTIQKYTNFETQMVSENAYNHILEYQRGKTKIRHPFNLIFDQDRFKFGKIKYKNNSKEKNKIMWEHVIPISNTINEFINNNNYCNLEEVLKYLKEYPGTCLITREEDDKLNEKYKTNRTHETWKEIYNSLGIVFKTRNAL